MKKGEDDMAIMNDEILIKNEITQKECGMYLQACLTKEELETLKNRWNDDGGYKVVPWWKFALDNIKVSL